MSYGIRTISLKLPFNLGLVNCYLIKSQDGLVLIDTGCSGRRKNLSEILKREGCKPGSLRLIVLTHGDFDHTGNAAFLRKRLGAKIALYKDDIGMTEKGNMFFHRKKGNFFLRWLAPVLFGFSRSERFTPDVFLQDGMDLSPFGLEARIISSPGHSKGSISVRLAQGELFCGDLLENSGKPSLSDIIDDQSEALASLEKIRKLRITTVYPGHGEPFPLEEVDISNK